MASPGAGGGMNSDQLRRVMRDLGDAVNAYQQGQGFGGIEKLASEIEQLRGGFICSPRAGDPQCAQAEGSRRHPQRVDPRLGTSERGDEEAGRPPIARTPARPETLRLDPVSLADLARLLLIATHRPKCARGRFASRLGCGRPGW